MQTRLRSGVAGRRLGSDPELLWLWRSPAAIAPIRPLAWEPSYAVGSALEKTKKKTRLSGTPVVAQWVTNPTRIHEDAVSIPCLSQWVKDPALL